MSWSPRRAVEEQEASQFEVYVYHLGGPPERSDATFRHHFCISNKDKVRAKGT